MRASIWSSVPRAPAVAPAGLVAQLALAEFGDLARPAFVFHHHERLAGRRHAGQAEDFHRRRRAGLLHRPALVVQHRAHAAPFGAGHDDVALLQRALLHQHGRHRATAAVEPAFDHRAFGGAVRVGAQVEDFGLQQDRFLQLVEAGLLQSPRPPRPASRRPFPRRRSRGCSSSWRTRFGIGVRLVHLVDGDDDRRVGRLGVADRLDGLRHHAVIGGHHQHHDVGHRGAARAHGGERLVARRVDEGDLLAGRQRHLIGADMLGDAAGLAGRHIGGAQRVEQRGLAVIDMAHDGDDRRPRRPARCRRRRRLPGRVRRRLPRRGATRWPNSCTTSSAVSASSDWVMVAITPMLHQRLDDIAARGRPCGWPVPAP